MITFSFGVYGGSAAKASTMHLAHKFFTGVSGVNIHGDWFQGRRKKRSGGNRGLAGRGSGRGSRTFLLSVPFRAALTNSDIDVGCNSDQFVESTDWSSGVNQLVFDTSGQVLVKAVLKIGGGVSGMCHEFFKQRGVLRNHRGILP